MPADLIHLVRHGEVHNPDRILYGRLPGFGLSELGHRMAQMSAVSMKGRNIVSVVASPLQRTRESAAPWGSVFDLAVDIDERLIEPRNRFEGTNVRRGIRQPRNWPYLMGPWRPTWGEPFVSIRARMMEAVADLHRSTESGEAVIVSHQLPIWMVTRTVQGKRLAHDPRQRRCSLSSITTLAHRDGRFVEVDYQEPAAELLAESIDLGAV